MHRLLTRLTALVVLATVGAVAPATGTPPAFTGTPAAKTVLREYGAGPVQQDHPRQEVRIRFRGHRGDRVMLTRALPGDDVVVAARIDLHGPDGRVRRDHRPWWRLHDTGWHTFRYAPFDRADQRIRLQLTKVRTVDLERDGGARTLPRRRGLLYAVGFRVPEDGLLSGAVTGSGSELLVRPGKGRGTPSTRESLLLGNGLPLVTSTPYGYPRSEALAAGQVVRLLTSGGQASAWTPTRVTGTLDGPAVPIDAADPARATEVVIDGPAGQWVRATSSEARIGAHVTLLLGPEGVLVDPTPFRDLWQLTGTGANRILVLPRPGTASTPLELHSVTQHPGLVVGGPPVTVTQDVPGRGVIVPVTGDSPGGYVKIATSNAALPGDWRVWLLVAHVPAYPRGCNGCGERDLVGAGPEKAVTSPGAGRYVYVPLPPGTTGHVDLQAVSSDYFG